MINESWYKSLSALQKARRWSNHDRVRSSDIKPMEDNVAELQPVAG